MKFVTGKKEKNLALNLMVLHFDRADIINITILLTKYLYRYFSDMVLLQNIDTKRFLINNQECGYNDSVGKGKFEQPEHSGKFRK